MYSLHIPVPIILRDLDLALLRGQAPNLSDSQLRSQLITGAIELYGVCKPDEFESDCGMRVRLAEKFSGYVIIEVLSAEYKAKFNFAPFYLYRSDAPDRREVVVPYDNFDAALNGYHAELNS